MGPALINNPPETTYQTMPDYPKVYAIVLNYNGRELTLDCLDSLYSMDYPAFSVMVVDNGSSDGTAQAVRAAFPQAEVVENSENLMFAGGNNVGIRRALQGGADYVLLLNNDTVVDMRLAAELIAAMKAHPEAGLACPMIYYYPPKDDGRELIWYAGGVVDFWRGLIAHRGIRQVDDGRYTRPECTGYVTGCGLMASRACLERVGLLDTAYNMYVEDVDLSQRAIIAGYSLLFVPGARMWHKVSATAGGEFSWFKIKNKIRSSLLFFRRYARPWHWLTIPLFVLARGIMFFLFRKKN